MGKMTTLKQMKGNENFLTPVSVVGVLVLDTADDERRSDFKLVTLNGVEYSILADSEWERVLENYRWEEVRVRGLLNAMNMTILVRRNSFCFTPCF